MTDTPNDPAAQGAAASTPASLDGLGFDAAAAPSPAFVVDRARLRANLEVISGFKARTGARVLLALKGFAMHPVFPMLREVLDGVCASSPHEARLGAEDFGGEVHGFAAAYGEEHVRRMAPRCSHMLFNSLAQWDRFAGQARQLREGIHLGLRVNPEHSEGHTPLYDPCAPRSRLGIRLEELGEALPPGCRGLHFHTLCEHNADALVRTLAAFDEKFGRFVPDMDYVNFGGGHHLTRADYDLDLLERTVASFKERYGVDVYLEPGEAVALNAGFLVTRVLDVVERGGPIAILDTAVPAHMPDVIEMPYRPPVVGAGEPGEKAWTCRLAGLSCLAGDQAGDYSFDAPLKPGDTVVFADQAHYTMVKTNTFNGIDLPALCLADSERGGEVEVVRTFGYGDFRGRLG
ncbi:carboxynorspermidine decarboxylase [Desulfohalovibrio reitneri]|uniref:carboxynorspermidine decarboxylase n=1 Tax=Desulfohalovibrio reitneri TaxID=1307759 RepID=UPI0009DD0B09|nr:carboxynorspermidine decarboxylase [Desulfohalovibrio reitneri]